MNTTTPRKGLRLNLLSEIFERQGYAVGTFLQIPSPQLVEMLGLAGFDFVVIDREHGSIDLERCEDLIRAAASTGICPIVRVPRCEEVAVRQPFDMGAAGIHVPQIHSAEMARIAVRGAKFHPLGGRGLQPLVRGASYNSYPTAEFIEQANRESTLVVHIEGAEGVANFEEIADVEGIDVAFLGPYDLSQSLGIPGQIDSPLVREKMQSVIAAAKGRDIAVGCYAANPQKALEWKALGVTYLAVSLDAHMFFQTAERLVSEIKGG